MSFLMTLTAAERDVILALRQKSGKHVFFDEEGAETAAPAPSVAANAAPKKRVLTEEQKAKMKAGREAARAKKVADAAEAALPAPPPCPPGAMLCATPAGESSAAAPAEKKKRSELTADASAEMKELWEKTNQELRDIYHPLVGKKVGMRTSAGLPDKLALVTEIVRLRTAGHTPENPAKTSKAE
jgi:hypothetical protein